MALQKTIEFGNGLTCPNAYIKVFTVGGGKEKVTIEIGISKDKAFSDAQNYIEKRYAEFIPSVIETSPNFIKQGYEYLKTMADYTGAIDV